MTTFIVSLFLSLAFAQSGSKDWKLVKETDAVMQVPVCRAYTQVSSNLPVAVELSISFPQHFDRAPMMILKVPANSGIQRAVVPLTAREQEDFLIFQAVTDPAGKDMLWYVPVQMEKLTDIIVGNSYLPLKFTKDGKEVNGRLSLNGSSATMNQVAACLKVSDYLPRKFFKELNTAAGSAPLGPDQTVQQLMIYVDHAFAHFQAIAQAEADLKKLRDANKTLLQQEADAIRQLTTAQTNLDRAQAAVDATTLKISNGEERLRLIPGEIAALQAQKPAAQQLYDQKKAAFEPLRQRAAELQADINSASNRVDTAEANIADAESTIASGQRKIRELEREADDLERKIRDLDNQMPALQRRENELQSKLNSYSVEFEKQRILSRDSSYQSLRNERPNVESSIRQKQGDLNHAQGRLRWAEGELRKCKASPNPQCANEENLVNQLSGEVSRLSSEVSSLQSRLSQIDSEMRNIEFRAEREAQWGRDQIVNELNQVSRELGELRSERERASNRLRDIQGFEIPRWQREVRDAQNDLPGYQRDLAAAQREFNNAVAALRNYKISVNYDAVKKEHDDAKAALDAITNGILNRQNEERQLNRDLPTWRNQLVTQQREVARLTPIRDAAKTKLDGIQAQLKTFREQEAAQVKAIETFRLQYDELRKLYQTLATLLLNS